MAIDAGKFNGKHPNTIGLLQAARETWDRALYLGEKHGFRNAQTTVMLSLFLERELGLLAICRENTITDETVAYHHVSYAFENVIAFDVAVEIQVAGT